MKHLLLAYAVVKTYFLTPARVTNSSIPSLLMRSRLVMLLLLIIISIINTGCFRRWVLSDKQIRAYYADKPVKPVFFTIANDSVRMFCATTGSDTLPPLIMIHGAPGAWHGSRNMLDDSLLQSKFHLISVDRLGYGKSRYKRKRRPVNSIDLQATAIHEVMRINRSFKTGVVIGSSYGAPIAAKMGIKYPDEFHHIMMLAPAIDPDQEKFWWFHRYIRSGLFLQVLPTFIRTATAEKFGHVDELRTLSKEWPRLNLPVTVMQGGRDFIIEPTNFDYAKRVLAHNKNANFLFFPESSHIIRRQNADTVKALVLESLKDVRPRGK